MRKSKILKQIEQNSEILGLENTDKTIFEILPNEQNNEKTLSLKLGSWQNSKPWFGIDEKGKVQILIDLDVFLNVVSMYKDASREIFKLKLERSILERMPTDFNDVWVVCMNEIKKLDSKDENFNLLNLNFDAIVEKVRSEHPNLFVDIKDLIEKRMQQ